MSSRRSFVSRLSGAAAGALLAPRRAPALVAGDAARPAIPHGAAVGDVTGDSAIVWSRSDRPARMIVEWSTRASFADVRRQLGPIALAESGLTARVDLAGLPADQTIVYRVLFQELADGKTLSLPVEGRFRSAPAPGSARSVRLAWSADVCGQGFGIDLARGGLRGFEAIRRLAPDVFVHCGDTIYADNPLVPELPLDDGSLWRNLVTPAKAKVAETLDEFRGNYLYNLLDDNLRRFNAEIGQLVIWDDHEVRNNWYAGQLLDDPHYTEKDVSVLAARAPARLLRAPADPARRRPARAGVPADRLRPAARRVRDRHAQRARAELGQHAAAQRARDGAAGPDPARLAETRARGVERRLEGGGERHAARSRRAGRRPRPPRGSRERRRRLAARPRARGRRASELPAPERVLDVVWVTGDVHYAAAHHYHPERARFTDFDPFWEFVAGPLHAGTFGPNRLDPTFGPAVRFLGIPEGMKPNRPPSEGLQFFGTLDVDAASRVLTARLHDVAGRELYKVELPPAALSAPAHRS